MKFYFYGLTIALYSFCLPAFSQDVVGDIADTTFIQRRVEARNYRSFSLGPASMSGLGVDQPGQFFSLGYSWETTPYAAVKGTASGAFNFGDPLASVVAGTLGANFFFTRTSISPYAGFDFGYGVAATGDKTLKSVNGWAGGVNLGVAFFRTSSVQMHIALSYLGIFANTGAGNPGYGALSLGIHY